MDIPGNPPKPSVSRPRAGMAVPVLIAIAALPALRPELFYADIYVVQAAYGVLWPLAVVGAGLWVRATLRRAPQAAVSDNWIYGSWFVLLYGWFSLISVALPRTSELGVFALGIATFLGVHYRPDLKRRLERSGPPWSTVADATGGLLLIPFVAAIILFPDTPRIVIWMGWFVVAIFVLDQVYENYYADDSLPIPDTFVHEYVSEFDNLDEPTRVLIVERDLPDAVEDEVHEAFRSGRKRWLILDDDPSIPTIQAVGEEPRPWLAIDAADTDRLPDIRQQLTLADVKTVITTVANAFERIGDQGLSCHNIRPEHIRVKDTDTDGTLDVTIDGCWLEGGCRSAVKSPQPTAYVAPECHEDPERGSEQATVYGLAALAYFTLTGSPPADVDRLDETDDGTQDEAQPNHQKSPLQASIDTVVRTGLDPEPSNRQQSISEFRQALTTALHEEVPDESASGTDSSTTRTDTQQTVDNRIAGATKTGRGANTLRQSVTRREAVSMAGVGLFGFAGYVYPSLGGANDPGIPDSLEYGFTSRTGKLQWGFETDDTVYNSPAIAEGTVYVGSWDGNLYALNTANGSLDWKLEAVGSEVYGPVVADNTVFVCDNRTIVYALDATDGTEQWRKQVEAAVTIPVVGDQRVYVGAGQAVALDKQTGTKLWNRNLADPSSPVVANGTAYFGTEQGVHALDTEDGSQAWVFETEEQAAAAAIGDETLYVRTYNPQTEHYRLYALDTDTATINWSIEPDDYITPNPVLDGDRIYVGFLDRIAALDAHSGVEQWEFNTVTSVSSPAVSDGTLYTGTGEALYAIDAADGTEQWAFETDDRMERPVVGENNLYVGNGDYEENSVYAIAVRDW